MIGDVVFKGSTSYVITNSHGTLEKLPRINWFRKLILFFKTIRGDLPISEIREYCRRHHK